MRKKVCVVGINNSLVNSVITHFINQGCVVNFISFNEIDLENPIYKRALNNIKLILHNDINKVQKALNEADLLINMALLPSAVNINNKLSTKINFTEKVLSIIGKNTKLVQFIPLMVERKMFYRHFDKIVKLIKDKQRQLSAKILYVSPVILKEESLILDLDKIMAISHKACSFNRRVRFSLITADFILQVIINSSKNINLGVEESCLSSKQSIGLDDIQNEILKASSRKICIIKMPLFFIKLCNVLSKIKLPTLSSNYYKCLMYNRGLIASKSNENLVENISLKKLVQVYFLDKHNES